MKRDDIAPTPASWPAGPPWHLALGDGATHAGELDACESCAAYLREHPETPLPAKAGS